MMPTHCIVEAEKDADMKSLSPEEAIAILNDMKIDIPVPKAAVTQRKRNVALDMAISAMSCSEIPNNSDTISRQAAIKILHEALDAADQIADVPFGVYQNYRDKMNELPSAQPEHIRGHWICDRSWSEGVGMGESYGHYWKCDKCGHLEQGDWGECGCNFCSNCGSDNREVTT